MAEPQRTYRGYTIIDCYTPIPSRIKFEYVHDDYGGPGDTRHGFGSSVAECKAEIDELIADEEEVS